MALITKLPQEILLSIFECLEDLPDLRALSLTCRSFEATANAWLYRVGGQRYPYLLNWACESGVLGTVERFLGAGVNPNVPFRVTISRESRCGTLADSGMSGLNHVPKLDTPTQILKYIYGYEPWQREDERIPDEYSAEEDEDDEDDEDEDEYDQMDTYGSVKSGMEAPYDPVLHHDIAEYSKRYLSGFWFPLHSAAMSGSAEIIKLLLDFGANINAPAFGLCQCRHLTPIFHEIEYRRPNYPFWTALHVAICHGNEGTAKFLLSSGASVNISHDEPRVHVLHSLAANNAISVIDHVLKERKDSNIDVQDSNGFTPLVYAATNSNSSEIARLLLQNGANPKLDLGDGCTFLHAAAHFGWLDEATQVLGVGADVNQVWNTSEVAELGEVRPIELCCNSPISTPDLLAIEALTAFSPRHTERPEKEKADLAKLLIKAGADVQSLAGSAHSPLVFASEKRRGSVLKALLDSGALIDGEDSGQLFPLIAAVGGPDRDDSWTSEFDEVYQIVKLLLERKAPPNQKNRSGATTLFRICTRRCMQANHLKIIKLLLEYGADINLRSPRKICRPGSGSQATLFAVHLGRNVDAYEITDNDAGAGSKGDNSPSPELLLYSPLQAAFMGRHLDTCEFLVTEGATVSADDVPYMFEDLLTYVETAVKSDLEACRDSLEKLFRFLVREDKTGWLTTDPEALWKTCGIFGLPLTEILLDNGAKNVSWVSANGKACLNRIMEKAYVPPNAETRALRLISLGADPNPGGLAETLIRAGNWSAARPLLESGAVLALNSPDDPLDPLVLAIQVNNRFRGGWAVGLVAQSLKPVLAAAASQLGASYLRLACATTPFCPESIEGLLAAGVDVLAADEAAVSAEEDALLVVFLSAVLDLMKAKSLMVCYERARKIVDGMKLLVEAGAVQNTLSADLLGDIRKLSMEKGFEDMAAQLSRCIVEDSKLRVLSVGDEALQIRKPV